MKIIIHSLDELLQLAALLDPRATMREGRIDNKVKMAGVSQFSKEVFLSGLQVAPSNVLEADPEGLPTDIAQPTVVPDDGNTVDTAAADADGAPYNTDWHSDPAKLTAKGLWRARRGRDEDAYKVWLLEQAVEVAEAAIAADDAEPVATETHALPQNVAREEGPGVTEPLPQASGVHVDLEALIAASQEAALDASDSHVDLLNACRDFTTKRGHPAFTALKVAVAPDGDSGQGKTVQHLTPGERRLMQACIANYPG